MTVGRSCHRTGTMRYASKPGWQAVELPYAGDELAMRVVVPTEDAPLADLLTPETQAAVAAGLHEERVAFFMPRHLHRVRTNGQRDGRCGERGRVASRRSGSPVSRVRTQSFRSRAPRLS